MKVIVKRFCLSHNGEIYKEGDVVEIEDTKTAKRLVARSDGDLEIYHGDEFADVEDEENENIDAENEDGGTSDDVSDSDSDDDAAGIPVVDPAAAVRTEGDTEKGGGRKK